MTGRVAIFVDGENLSAIHARAILSIGAAAGSPDVARVYMNAACNSEWHAAAGFRLIHAGIGKNAADLLLRYDRSLAQELHRRFETLHDPADPSAQPELFPSGSR